MAWRVFYSYSHKDADFRDKLGTYLAPLRQQQKILEWYDRRIEPGADWDSEISAQLESADVIMMLLSADFLASEYCFGVEVEKALMRLKRGEVKVVPILLRPCLWEESRFSELQIIPRDAKPITSWTSADEAFKEVANEIRRIVSEAPPSPLQIGQASSSAQDLKSSLELVRAQVRSYARLYERTRQRMKPSDDRTQRMQKIFDRMRALATASYPLLDELADSPSPGEHLSAVAILQVFGSERLLPFLVRLVGSEKPFVAYHATKALRFAVGALDPHWYPMLMEAIRNAKKTLGSSSAGLESGRQAEILAAEQELKATLESLSAPSGHYD